MSNPESRPWSTRLAQAICSSRWKFLLLILGIAVWGCADSPMAVRPTVPAAATLSNGADQGWVRSSFQLDYFQFVPCLGENVHVFGEVPFQTHTVANPSGGFDIHRLLLPVTPHGPQFYIQGVSSGTLYTYANGHAISESGHVAAGQVYSFHEADVYHAADGSSLYFTSIVHATVNANGELTATRLEFEDLNCG